jgi:hypothetical protein
MKLTTMMHIIAILITILAIIIEVKGEMNSIKN